MTPTRRAWTPRPLHGLALAVLSLGLAACETLAPAASNAAPAADRIHRQAQEALDRWAQAVARSGGASISFVGPMTSQIGDWENAVGDNNKQALMAGVIAAATTLPDDPPPRDEVRWLDGSKVDVNVLSAADALEDLVEAGDGAECPDCRPLRVTDAQLATGLVETSRGPAEAPMWVFSLAGTAVTVTRVAVDESVTVAPPPWNADDPPQGISIERAAGTADSDTLEVSFTGAVENRNQPCGADYTAEAVESELAVVVIVVERANPAGGACPAMGRTRTATATLKAPLGERAVLEVQQGLPVQLLAP
jgi:hypothetical protein